MSRIARIVLASALTVGALVVGGVALAANPAPAAPSSAETVPVQQGGPNPDCPYESGDTGTASAFRL